MIIPATLGKKLCIIIHIVPVLLFNSKRGILCVFTLFSLMRALVWLAVKNVGSWNNQQKPPPAPPTIVLRDQWGARPINLEAPEEFGLFDADVNPEGVLYYPEDLASILNTIVVHHSAFPSSEPLEIQELHM